MESERSKRALALVEEALERAPTERAEWLDSRCGGDRELRETVERWLAREPKMEGFLDPPAGLEVSEALREVSDLPEGAQLGNFKLVRVLASGGMGTVYEAEQEHPRRRVALKVLRRGLSSRTALRRFHVEAEYLGRLRHPAVAQIFEAGTHRVIVGGAAREIPYFALELVDGGRTIVEFAREQRLGLRARVELMVSVCEAVHHGHEKGVIHRDLKPGNILVDPSGHPKVIDFGVACASARESNVTSHDTRIGHIVGTLPFMSPEQLEEGGDVDLRSDVYALGVVLYELACGALPFPVDGKPLHEAARVIREDAPRRPSAATPGLPRPLEWILLKSIEKDRARRYASASELAADLRRFLADEPVSAGAPSTTYRLRMFARRHRAGVAAAAVAAAALVVGTTGLAVGLVRERSATQEALRQKGEAETARASAQRDADMQRTLYEALRGIIAPGESDPDGAPTPIVDLLGDAVAGIDSAYADRPEIAASLRQTFGAAYARQGFPRLAAPLLLQALESQRYLLGEDHPDTIESLVQLGDVQRKLGNTTEAMAALEEAVQRLRRTSGDDDRKTRRAIRLLSFAADSDGDWLRSEALERELTEWTEKLRRTEDAMTLSARVRRAAAAMRHGRAAEAEEMLAALDDTLRRRLGESSTVLANATHHRGVALLSLGRLDEADVMLRRSMEIARPQARAGPPDAAVWPLDIAELHLARGEFAEAERIARELVSAAPRRAATGLREPAIAAQATLGRTLAARGEFAEALPLLEQALAGHRRAHGPRHPTTFQSVRDLATAKLRSGDAAGAKPLFAEAHSIAQRALGDAHPWTIECAAGLAACDEAPEKK